MAYLDHAATSPLRPEAREAMLPWLGEQFGNPSGSHSVARRALRALDDARQRTAAALGAEPADVVFTSGGTEADNLAIFGAVGSSGGTAMCSAVEHPGVLEPVRILDGVVVPVDDQGVLDLEVLGSRLPAGDLAVFSLMAVNNETGVIQPVRAASEIVRSRAPAAVVHVDAVQAAGILDLEELTAGADAWTLSAHKFGGPQGAGVLVARARARGRLEPVLRGGPQERELRAGTQNLAAICGLAAALEVVEAAREASRERLAMLGDELEAGLCAVEGVVPAIRPGTPRSPAIRNVQVDGVEAEELLFALDRLGVCASAGSACASGALEPSHVLMAMGRPSSAARRHVRFSLGWTTTPAEVGAAVGAFAQAVERLRG